MKLRFMFSFLLVSAAFLPACKWLSRGVGHGGTESRDCRPERFCNRDGCEDRLICKNKGSTLNTIDERGFDQRTDEIWQERFGVSVQSLKILDHALAVAYAGSFDGLARLGFSEKDIRSIAYFKMPTSEGIANLSQALGVSRSQGRAMLNFMIKTAKRQATDIHSSLWEKCVESGDWLTPENNACEKTYWKGCSPQTGATMCVPAD